MKKAPLFMIIMSFLLAACDKDDIEITDNDGNVYQGVKIGNQIWMTENLRTTTYPDGSAIPYVEDNTAWDELEVFRGHALMAGIYPVIRTGKILRCTLA